LRIDILIYLQ